VLQIQKYCMNSLTLRIIIDHQRQICYSFTIQTWHSKPARVTIVELTNKIKFKNCRLSTNHVRWKRAKSPRQFVYDCMFIWEPTGATVKMIYPRTWFNPHSLPQWQFNVVTD
jgi:hypothetical protein